MFNIQFLYIQYMYYRNTVEYVAEMHGILYFKLLFENVWEIFPGQHL